MAPTTNIVSPVTEQDVKTIISHTMGSGWKILNYELEPFTKVKKGVLGTHLSLTVKVRRKSQSDNPVFQRFFVKIQPDSPLVKEVMMDDNMYSEEVHFYSKVYPLMKQISECKKWSPCCFLATDNVLIFEDLRDQGYVLRENCRLDEYSLKLALTALARFHASSLTVEAKLGKKLNDAFPDAFAEKMYCKSNKFGRGTVVGYETNVLLAEKFGFDSSLIPKIHDRVYERVRAMDGECNVICHGDLWKNNLLFNDIEQNCILVDFQLLRYASVAVDIGMLLYLHTTEEDRKKFESSLLKHYYSVLYDTLLLNNVPKSEIPKYESILKEFNEHRLVGLTYASLYSPGIHQNPDDLADIMNDPVKLKKWFLKERIDFIIASIDKNLVYEKLLKDIMTELMAEANKIFFNQQ